MSRDGGPVVGIVGGGQLARMTAQAAVSLDITVRVLAASPDDSAAAFAHIEVAESLDAASIGRFGEGCDVITFDHELVPPDDLLALEAAGHVLRPSAAASRFAQDKAHQRTHLAALGFPVPSFHLVESIEDIEAFALEHGWPLVAKAARGGYDGRGVWVLEDQAAAARLIDEAGLRSISLLVEPFVPIVREVAVLVARRPSGGAVTYPVVETVQVDGMCRELLLPAPVPPEVDREARDLATRIAEAIGATGIMALELFVTDAGLVVNELALRPHNSGHWTIEGAVTSQFENHLRAVLDWPLGATELAAPAVATVNVVGGPDGSDPRTRRSQALEVPGIHVHLYGKGARPGRKLGHVTALGGDADDTRERAGRAAALLTGEEAAGEEADR